MKQLVCTRTRNAVNQGHSLRREDGFKSPSDAPDWCHSLYLIVTLSRFRRTNHLPQRRVGQRQKHDFEARRQSVGQEEREQGHGTSKSGVQTWCRGAALGLVKGELGETQFQLKISASGMKNWRIILCLGRGGSVADLAVSCGPKFVRQTFLRGGGGRTGLAFCSASQ